jgi:signal transduction histidine kinase/ActR/RegA family two-component response regulator
VRILIVEDEPAVCNVLHDSLREMGHDPLIAHSAEAALETLNSERLDAILLDVHLPTMSGLEFLRLQSTRTPAVPVVAMSGVATESQARECMRLGAIDFIGKPIGFERLAQVLSSLRPDTAPEPVRQVERRRAFRVPVTLPVHVVEPTGTVWDGTSVNLSVSGIKLRADRPVRPGAAAKLTIRLPDEHVPLELGSVLTRADLDGYAFHFVNVPEGQRERLSALVQRVAVAQLGQAPPHLRIVRTIGEALTRSLDFDETLRVALDALTRVTGHEIASLHLLSADGMTLQLQGDRGLLPRLRELTRELPVGRGLIGQVAATGQTMHVPDAGQSPDLFPEAALVVARERIRGFVCVPIRSRGRVLGALSLGRRTPEPFSGAEITLLEVTADQIGLALETARLYSETRRQLDDLEKAGTQLAESAWLSSVGQLAAGLVHEINNPLAIILAQAQLLIPHVEPEDKRRERLGTILRETSRAARLLKGLLKLTRRGSPERLPCLLEEQVRWVLELHTHMSERNAIRVVTELELVPPVWADEDQIRQVLLNLVQNAHQAMAAHSGDRVLTLRIAGLPGRVRIEVLDTGPGIPADVLPRIFDAFFTTKSRDDGSGLGLWVSCAIVEQHGGRLRAENRPEGGAAFSFELPYGGPPVESITPVP